MRAIPAKGLKTATAIRRVRRGQEVASFCFDQQRALKLCFGGSQEPWRFSKDAPCFWRGPS